MLHLEIVKTDLLILKIVGIIFGHYNIKWRRWRDELDDSVIHHRYHHLPFDGTAFIPNHLPPQNLLLVLFLFCCRQKLMTYQFHFRIHDCCGMESNLDVQVGTTFTSDYGRNGGEAGGGSITKESRSDYLERDEEEATRVGGGGDWGRRKEEAVAKDERKRMEVEEGYKITYSSSLGFKLKKSVWRQNSLFIGTLAFIDHISIFNV